jgi:predicted double-glycine peptidase
MPTRFLKTLFRALFFFAVLAPNLGEARICNTLFAISENLEKFLPPLVAQTKNYTCGPASVLSWLKHLGVNTLDEAQLEKILHTTEEIGTPTRYLVNGLKRLGFTAKKSKLKYSDLSKLLRANAGIFLRVKYRFEEHWVLVVSANRNHVVLMDPIEAHDNVYVKKNKRDLLKIWTANEGDQIAVVAKVR